jgi:hypothetical protein
MGGEDTFDFLVFVHLVESFVEIIIEEGDTVEFETGLRGLALGHDGTPGVLAEAVDLGVDDGDQGEDGGGVVGDLDLEGDGIGLFDFFLELDDFGGGGDLFVGGMWRGFGLAVSHGGWLYAVGGENMIWGLFGVGILKGRGVGIFYVGSWYRTFCVDDVVGTWGVGAGGLGDVLAGCGLLDIESYGDGWGH